MRDDFDSMVADRFTALDDVAVPDTWSRVQHKLLDPTPTHFADHDITTIDVETPNPTTEVSQRGRWMLAAAAALLVVTAAVLLAERDPHEPAAVTTSPPPATTTATVEASFAVAIESAGLLTEPSAEEVALASDTGAYQPNSGPIRVSAADNFVELRTCRPSPFVGSTPSTCGTEWAYITGSLDGGEVRRGLLGAAARPELYMLDDRFFVAMEIERGSRPAPLAWLIDSVSGRSAELSWRDEPTTISSRDQAVVIFDDPSPVSSMWSESPFERFLPRVVDARDGTIRPLAVPDNALAAVSVAQNGIGRIWIGTTPNGHDLGVAYSDDGGATWTEVTLPQLGGANTDELASVAVYGDDLLSIAADGDRIAVTEAWSYENNRSVYVSGDAGLSWSIVPLTNPEQNGSHLYVLDDERLLLVRSNDAYATHLFVSAGTDWTRMDEDLQATAATRNHAFSVTRTGTVYVLETDSNTGHPSGTVVSTDLTNWWTIAVPEG